MTLSWITEQTVFCPARCDGVAGYFGSGSGRPRGGTGVLRRNAPAGYAFAFANCGLFMLYIVLGHRIAAASGRRAYCGGRTAPFEAGSASPGSAASLTRHADST